MLDLLICYYIYSILNTLGFKIMVQNNKKVLKKLPLDTQICRPNLKTFTKTLHQWKSTKSAESSIKYSIIGIEITEAKKTRRYQTFAVFFSSSKKWSALSLENALYADQGEQKATSDSQKTMFNDNLGFILVAYPVTVSKKMIKYVRNISNRRIFSRGDQKVTWFAWNHLSHLHWISQR